ncbi:uncharacterized protein LOC102807321 [Saccoglossus kowalevskii]|uniref:Uncharacterized protein LOC102807321 n=1 Tax=Saccoglossus kowalevskii TaxID=10224 RepID=A0ABM0ME72_SACKO|nr:PREDICTED: uncharacterized protein LOC102807321 [Saccoglossus kowalevskii]
MMMYGPFYVALMLVLVRLQSSRGQSQLGEVVDDKIKDVLFRNMGQIYVEEFNIDNQLLTLEVIAEDTIGTSELWVVDFQPYDFDENNQPVDPDTGDITSDNTGECSNILADGGFSSFGPAYYFSDAGNFETRNVSLRSATKSDGKRLFTNYVRGQSYNTNDQYGNSVDRRDYTMRYQGHLGYFFNCTDTTGTNIWTYMNTTDTIEYHTTMYVTNVRPVDNADASKGMARVSSSITLIYRLSRIAIANFVISSSPLVKPIIDYVIISPYFDANGEPLTNKATIEIQFKTVIQSNAVDGFALQFKADTQEYTPENSGNSFSNDTGDEIVYTAGPKQCVFVSPNECTQTWNFVVVLNVDDTVVESDVPIDATGVFKFQFEQLECSSTTTDPPSSCVLTSSSLFEITLDVTIQTVVVVRDADKDYPSLYLLSITGANNNDLRGGVRAGNRGVNHLESVNMKIQMLPEFFRDVFNLELTLFMVCRDDTRNLLGGCLDVETGNRYIAYRSDDFRFVALDSDGNDQIYSTSHLAEDNWVPTGNSSTQQMLDSYSYDTTNELYNIDWTNAALAQERSEYTITTVFKLEEKLRKRKRKKRAAIKMVNEDFRNKGMVVVNSAVYSGHRLSAGALARRAELLDGRDRRDAIDYADEPTAHHASFAFAGCPKRSLYVKDTLTCDCLEEDETYSNTEFECTKSEFWQDVEPKVLGEPSRTGKIALSKLALYPIFSSLLYQFISIS